MADPMMYREEMFVFLTPDAEETFMTPPELIEKLVAILTDYDGVLAPDIQRHESVQDQAQYLLETHCEFETSPGESVQWYAVRLEK